MIGPTANLPGGVQVHLALGYTDMRKGIDGLAGLVSGVLRKDPMSGHLFLFRGRDPTKLKVLYWDGSGLCLYLKRLDEGGFVWPRLSAPESSIGLTSAQLAMLLEGLDWRSPNRVWKRAVWG